MIHIQDIDHVVLRCARIDTTLAFYRDTLGATVERTLEELGLYQLRVGTALIDLVPVDSPLGQEGGAAPGLEGHNMDHLCLRLEPFDGAAILNYLDQQQIPHGGLERRYGASGFGPSIYLTDPEGNRIELKGPADSLQK